MKSKKTYFNNVKDRLPIHEAPEFIWNNIEEHFKNREHDIVLAADFTNLPVHEPEEAVWIGIEQKLKKQRKVFHLKPAIYIKVASTILIVVGISVLFTMLIKTSKYTVYYSSETKEPSTTFEQLIETDDLSNLIKSTCIQKPAICQNEFFIELKNELKALESEKIKIEQAYLKNNTNQLLTYLQYIEDQKVEIQKKILRFSNNI